MLLLVKLYQKEYDMKTQKMLLGKRIREFRKAKGLTQEKLAEMADLDYTSIGAIERGVFNPSLDTAHRIAKALKIEIHELITLPAGHAITEKEVIIAKINRNLEKSDLKALRLIDGFIQNLITWVKKNVS
jgi:transcriptional regulator with XRE-family HTH domain